MYQFGAGVLIGTPLLKADGTAITVPSPVQFGVLQEVTVDEDFESKPLFGANQYPVAVGRGKGTVTLKAKVGLINAELYNTVFYGQTLSKQFEAIYQDLVGTLVPGTGATGGDFNIRVAPPLGTWQAALGARDGNGVPFTRVPTGPTGGQYMLGTAASGDYTFSTQDHAAGVRAFINYAYGSPTGSTGPATQQYMAVANQPMGYQPSFQVDLQGQYAGKTFYVRYPNCISTKLNRTMKNDDWTIPEFDIQAFVDSNNNISYVWWYD